MHADDMRLLGIPHSRDIIANLDPQHDSDSRVPTPLEAGPSTPPFEGAEVVAGCPNQCSARMAQKTS